MKKVVKKTLIYGGTAAVLGGTVAGITVAVLNAKKEVHKAKTFGEDNQVSTHQDIKDLESHSEEGGKKERKLLDKVKYHLSFKLYEEEQKGSFEFQKADFKFQMYEKAKEAIQQMVDNKKIGITSLTNGNQTYDKDFINNPLKINEVEKDFDNFIDWAKKEVDSSINSIKNSNATKKIKDENISKAKKLKNKLEDLKEEHTKINEKLDNVNNSKIDFNESSVSTNYPLLLLPIKIIREKQEKILSDAKESFISSPTFKTKEEGQAAWPQNLIDKYAGATSEKEAVDFLVSNETQSNAFKRYRYKINDNFTVEKIVTGIYNDIFNIKTKFKTKANVLDQSSIVDNANSKINTQSKNTITLFANKDFTKSTDLSKSLQEKVYFLGTESLVINSNNKNYFAPNLNDTKMQKYIESLIGTKIAKVENAIIGLTPNSEDNQAAWQYGSQIKDKRQAIRNALKLFVGGDNKKPKYLTGYNNANEIFGQDNDLSKNLISQITATQDSSKYKGGDYGWKSQLDNVKGMTAGFGVGLIGAFKDMTEESETRDLIKTSLDGSTFNDKMNSVKRIYKAIFDGLNNFIQAKGGTKLKNYSTSTPSSSDISNYNRTLQTFTDEKMLSDDDILKYIGSSVRKEINNTTKLFLDQSGNHTSTLPPIIDIGVDQNNKKNEGHVYIFTTEEYGMHLVRVTKGASILTKINVDMVKVANEQDTKEANTDYVSLLNNALTTNKQLEDLLGLNIDQTSGKPALSKNVYTNQIDTDFKNGDFKEYKDDKTSANLKEDIAWLIKSLKTADIFSKLKQSIPQSYSDWLTKLVDNKVMLEPKESGLAPEDIYNWALKEEEK